MTFHRIKPIKEIASSDRVSMSKRLERDRRLCTYYLYGLNDNIRGIGIISKHHGRYVRDAIPQFITTGYLLCLVINIAGRIFNQKKVVEELDIDRGTKDINCDCGNSKFCYEPVGHHLTIVRDAKLRSLIEGGPSFTEQEMGHNFCHCNAFLNTVVPAVPLSDERAKQIIDKALESSSLKIRNVVSVLTGLMGSGKTWLLSRLFNQEPPNLYTSTGMAEQSLRGLLHHLINIAFISWEPFTHGQILEFLACLFQETLSTSEEMHIPATTKALTTSTPNPTSSSTTESSPSSLTNSFSPMVPVPIPVSGPIPEGSAMKSMLKLVKAPMGYSGQEMLELVHMIDTGGQPELLENLPSLLHHSHLTVLVLNIVFELDKYPSIDYHEEGKRYKRALPSQYTNRQIIQKLASTLQAKRFSQTKDQPSQVLVVATHRDCIPEDELLDRVKNFDQALRNILLPSSNE